jgi:hypothetical protein
MQLLLPLRKALFLVVVLPLFICHLSFQQSKTLSKTQRRRLELILCKRSVTKNFVMEFGMPFAITNSLAFDFSSYTVCVAHVPVIL